MDNNNENNNDNNNNYIDSLDNRQLIDNQNNNEDILIKGEKIEITLPIFIFKDHIINDFHYKVISHNSDIKKIDLQEIQNMSITYRIHKIDDILDNKDKKINISQDSNINSEIPKCSVCFENNCKIINIPCGHICCCNSCSLKIDNCPICRELIHKKYPIFF